jgi:hypothetical protein
MEGIFGGAALVVAVLLIRNHSESIARKILSGFAISLTLLAMAASVAFIAYATHLCRHQFDLLK